MSASFLIDWEASLPCCCVQASVAIRCMPATNPAYPLASYLLARSGRKSTGKTKRKLLRPRHQIARINVRYGRSRPARRTGIAKSYYPAKTGQLPSKPDRLSAVFLFGGELALPHGSDRLSGERPETTSDSDAGHRFAGPIFQNTPSCRRHCRAAIMDFRTEPPGNKISSQIQWVGCGGHVRN